MGTQQEVLEARRSCFIEQLKLDLAFFISKKEKEMFEKEIKKYNKEHSTYFSVNFTQTTIEENHGKLIESWNIAKIEEDTSQFKHKDVILLQEEMKREVDSAA